MGSRVVGENALELGRLEAAFNNSPIGMAVLQLDGTFLHVNPAMCDLTGYASDELVGLTVEDITHPDDYEEQVSLMRRLLAGEMESYTVEKRYTRRSGEVIWVMLAVSLVEDDEGTATHLIAQTANISARKQVEADLRHEAGLDPLTELTNRRQLLRAIDNQMVRAAEFGETAALLVMDLDGFKAVNDRHGHETGDRVLRSFAAELRRQFRLNDLCARLGGDEFVVLMDGVDPERAPEIANQLTTHFEEIMFDSDGLALSCAISVGWAAVEGSAESPEDVLARADRSMYEAKRARKAHADAATRVP
jgi:diguanylate cyclase (GGDEF)-like protein/PAS domain S-box-containing protein